MKIYQFTNYPKDTQHHGTWAMMVDDLIHAPIVHTGQWQAMDTSASPAHATHELEDVTLRWDQMPASAGEIYGMMPYIDHAWASEHFEERVCGQPLNPAPSHVRWPYAVRGNADHTNDAKFDHTYPERFWPVFANEGTKRPNGRQVYVPHNGIRFEYGDLDDVVDLLVREPLTRQAYLPIWFPEDTGAFKDDKPIRVPCTLGYHFMQRGGKLSVRYYMRSCDVYRHLANDVFFAAALTNWVCAKVNERSGMTFEPGSMTMHISSLHAFVADVPKIKGRLNARQNVMTDEEEWGAAV